MSRVVETVALDVKGEFETQVRRAAGGDLQLSGWQRVKRITARYTIDAEGDETSVTFVPSAGGPMKVLTSGRRAGSKRTRRGRRRSVSWGSTRSRHVWDLATQDVERTFPDRMDAAARRVIERVLHG